jgi:hypothetical protein
MKNYNATRMRKKLEEIRSFMESNSHNDRHENYIAVNVKVYANIVRHDDLEDFLKTTKFTQEQQEFLISEITEKWMIKQWDWYLEFQGRYFTEDFIGGCTISGSEHYESVREEVKNGEKTSYPYIDSKRSVKTKLETIDKWDREDRRQANYLSLIDTEEIGFFGRSGGWLVICKKSFLDVDHLEYSLDHIAEKISYDTKEDVLYEFNSLADRYNAVKWLFDEATMRHKEIPEGWKDELEFRLTEYLEDNFEGEDDKIEEKLEAIAE